MEITCLSDLHGFYPENLPGGDLLILAGDYTATDKIFEWAYFFSWLKRQNYRKKILIAGNHDGFLFNAYPKTKKEAREIAEVQEIIDLYEGIRDADDFEYLCDSGTEFEGVKIWGTPWTNWFHGVNPKCKFFMDKEKKNAKKFAKIPDGTDIVIAHSPMYGILDQNMDGDSCGSVSLRERIDVVNPKYFIFGHIHEQGGKEMIYKMTPRDVRVFNCSVMNEYYIPVNSGRSFVY